jgi:hypothetical protein
MSGAEWFQSVEVANRELGRKSFVPCVELLLYGIAEREAFGPAVQASMRAILERHAGAFGWYKTNTMKVARQAAAEPVGIAVNYLASIQVKRPKLAGIELHSGPAKTEFDVPAIDFFSTIVPTGPADRRNSRTYLRLALPPSFADEPDVLRDVCREIVQHGPLFAAQCGWSFYWSVTDPAEKDVLRAHARGWLNRFPGLNYGNPLVFLEFIGDGLLGVSWLTYIASSALEARDRTVKQTLQDLRQQDIAAEAIGETILEVQAGPAPELGDRNRNDLLPSYGRVAERLAFLKLDPDQSQYIGMLGMDLEARTAWYERFFGGA